MTIKRLLHIATDNKFLDYALPSFNNLADTRNSTWIIHTEKNVTLTKSKIDLIIDPKKLARSNTSSFDAVILHSFKSVFAEFVLEQPAEMPILWIGWGFDYYDLTTDKQSLLLPLTQRLNTHIYQSSKLRTRLKKLLDAPSQVRQSRIKLKCIERINFFAPVLSCEFDPLMSALDTRNKPKFIDWNYGTLEDQYAPPSGDGWVQGNNILIGNSATSTCNHLDAINTLANCSLGRDQNVIMPLSYGDAPPAYSAAVSKAGYEAFGSNCQPLTQLMSLTDYLNTLSHCGFVIMNHLRQQAMGNIISMLFAGARIFLQESNPACQELRTRGFIISTVQELEVSPELIKTPLSDSERKHNRELTVARWSRAEANMRTESLVTALTHG